MKKLMLALMVLPLGLFAQERQIAKNVILLIGDGMGLSQISTAFYYNDGKSNFQRFRNIGLINTSSAKEKITDSAAGATAFATGKRTYSGAISVDTSFQDIPNLIELIQDDNVKSGLIATSSIVHATPACFYAHADSRRKYEKIAEYLPKSGVDFFAGGGLKFFNKRSDNLDFYRELIKKGYIMDTVALDPNMDIKTAKKYGWLLAEDGMDSKLDGRDDFLKEATSLAIKHLSKSENGFFLMVEGSQIDWEGHAYNAQGIIQEVEDFDKAIGEALNFAEVDGNTLVIVTADHETGGFALPPTKQEDGHWDYNNIDPQFYKGADDPAMGYAAHTATLIPVFAYGPGSERFGGIYDNTKIFHHIMKLTGWNRKKSTDLPKDEIIPFSRDNQNR